MGDQEAQGDVFTVNGSGDVNAGLAVRYSTTTRGYLGTLEPPSANEVCIYEDNAGFTLLASADRGLVHNTTYAATFRAVGGASSTALTLIIGGTTAVTFTDTTAPATGAPGMHLFTANTAIDVAAVDNFAVDDLVVPAKRVGWRAITELPPPPFSPATIYS